MPSNEYGRAQGLTVSQVLRDGAEALMAGELIVNYVSITNTQGTPGMDAPTIVVIGSPSAAGRSISPDMPTPA